MRKYKFEEYKKELKERYYKNFLTLETKRNISNRPREKEDMKILGELIETRFKKWIESGKLVIAGDRKYKLEI